MRIADRPGTGRLHEDLAAERAVLGAVLSDNAVIASVAEVIQADDFSSSAHSQIFSAMLALDLQQRPVDHLTLSDELKVRGHLTATGGPAYLMTLDQLVPYSANATQYAQIVKAQAIRRRLAAAGPGTHEQARHGTGGVERRVGGGGRRG